MDQLARRAFVSILALVEMEGYIQRLEQRLEALEQPTR